MLSRYYKRMNSHRAYVKGCLMKLQELGFHGVDDVLRNFRLYGEDAFDTGKPSGENPGSEE